MNASAVPLRLKHYLMLSLGLVLILLFPGEPAHAALLPASSVTVQMSDPACVEAAPASGSCAIEVNSLTATGSDTSFSRIELLVNGKLRLLMNGFFESSAYFTEPMLPGGLKVVCGRPNAGGQPNFGNSYSISANAYMADGTWANNSMTVFCPAYDGKTFLPSVSR